MNANILPYLRRLRTADWHQQAISHSSVMIHCFSPLAASIIITTYAVASLRAALPAVIALVLTIGLTQLRHSASQRRVFACGSMVLCDHMFVVFCAHRAQKTTNEKE